MTSGQLQSLPPAERLRVIDQALRTALNPADRIWLEGERKKALAEMSPLDSVVKASESISIERREA